MIDEDAEGLKVHNKLIMAETRAQRDQEGSQTRSGSKRPPLPLPSSKKRNQIKKKAKPSNKDVAEAKKQTAAKEAAKDQPVTIKTEPPPKRRMWTDEEDLALCKAYVNITTDPSIGTKQKGDAFWMRIQKKLYELYGSDAEVVATGKQWNYKSVESRFKALGKAVQSFNGYYKAVVKNDESGWTEQMHIDAACELFLHTEGKPFKFPLCARVLHGCPKFKPTNDPIVLDEDDAEAKPASASVANPIATIQGKGLPTPMGTKKAMAQKGVDVDSMATSSAHTDAVLKVATATEHLNKSFDMKTKIDSMHKSVESYIKLGMTAKAHHLLEEIELLTSEISKKEESVAEDDEEEDVPNNIALDETLGLMANGTYRSLTDDALDDGDDGSLGLQQELELQPRNKQATESTDSEDSSNHSQASSTAEGKAKQMAKQAKNMTGV